MYFKIVECRMWLILMVYVWFIGIVVEVIIILLVYVLVRLFLLFGFIFNEIVCLELLLGDILIYFV